MQNAPPGLNPTNAVAEPRLTVIVPVRNDPRRLARCLAALAQSSLRDFEVIVVDDASTDDTADVAESLGAKVIRLPARSGPAAARNVAAGVARGAILMFVDSDVCVHPQTLAVAVAALDDPAVDAVFGSYDLEPAEPNLLSQYKNLAHRYYHQASPPNVGTFWSGCGAIRSDVFKAFQFDGQQFRRPSIEDIELGVRLTAAGKRIVIDKQMTATHLKRWSLSGIVRSDLLDRAIPWTRVMHRHQLSSDLNLSIGQRIAALLTALSAVVFLVACWFKPWLAAVPVAAVGLVWIADRLTSAWRPPAIVRWIIGAAVLIGLGAAGWYGRWWSAAVAAPLLVVVALNAPFYRYFLHHRGPLVAAAAFVMQAGYYLYSLLGFAIGSAIHAWETWPQAMEDARQRVRLYVVIATMLYAVGWGLVLARAHVKHALASFVVSDAVGMYVYLPSIIIDHDLNFDNQVQGRVPAGEDDDFKRELRHNRYQTGMAITLLPAFLVAHGLSLTAHAITGSPIVAPDGYTVLYQMLCVAWAMSFGVIGLIAADRVLAERYGIPGRLIAAAVLLTWLGTNYVWYFTREPLLMHMTGAAWISLCIYFIHRIELTTRTAPLRVPDLAMLALAASMALIIRATNACIFPMFIYLLIVLIRRKQMSRLVRVLPLVLPALAPLAVQLLIGRMMLNMQASDAVHVLGYDNHERFYWLRPALLRTLFSSRHGLIFSSPALLLAAWGIARGIRQRHGGAGFDGLLISAVISAAILWYINSAWYAWWFGPSVGSRAFVELAGVFIIGFGLALQALRRLSLPLRRAVYAALVLAVGMNYFVAAAKMFDLVGENKSLIPLEDRILSGPLERI
jgi:GT2 family glycosyltransferase